MTKPSNGPHVLIAGGGVAGLAMALTLHQIGVPFTVFEAVSELRPLGVGINVQPNAVRELLDLGITKEELEAVGVPVQEWALVSQQGQEIYKEPRGTFAGYNYPQYAMHRGQFQMLLAHLVAARAGPDAIQLGARVIGYEVGSNQAVTANIKRKDGTTDSVSGTLLIGADGLHSKVRTQMHPDQPPMHWGGAILWRGTSRAKPIRTQSSFIGLGNHRQRMVIYPISKPDPKDGLALINWIAEITVDDPTAKDQVGWFKQTRIDDFVHHFADWTYDWLDVPELMRSAEEAYESPMVDRDPVDTWQDGPVILIGDAAHAMYPTGSNGASQAIIDARQIGLAMLEHGVTPTALATYDSKFCGPISELILRNRGAGPFGLLNLVNDRCNGVFENIDDVVAPSERAEFMALYKSAAGFAMDVLNASSPTIAAGSKIGQPRASL